MTLYKTPSHITPLTHTSHLSHTHHTSLRSHTRSPTYTSHTQPHVTNTRAPLAAIIDEAVEKEAPLYGFEQEYTMLGKNGSIYGWPEVCLRWCLYSALYIPLLYVLSVVYPSVVHSLVHSLVHMHIISCCNIYIHIYMLQYVC